MEKNGSLPVTRPTQCLAKLGWWPAIFCHQSPDVLQRPSSELALPSQRDALGPGVPSRCPRPRCVHAGEYASAAHDALIAPKTWNRMKQHFEQQNVKEKTSRLVSNSSLIRTIKLKLNKTCHQFSYSYASISREIFQHFLLFLHDRLCSLVFSFNNMEYTLFLILCWICQKSIFRKHDSGSTQYLRLTVWKCHIQKQMS